MAALPAAMHVTHAPQALDVQVERADHISEEGLHLKTTGPQDSGPQLWPHLPPAQEQATMPQSTLSEHLSTSLWPNLPPMFAAKGQTDSTDASPASIGQPGPGPSTATNQHVQSTPRWPELLEGATQEDAQSDWRGHFLPASTSSAFGSRTAGDTMERVAFLIEETNERLGCMLNPEALVVRRVAGLQPQRSISGPVTGLSLSDDPLFL